MLIKFILKFISALFIVFISISCTQKTDPLKQEIVFWHFWSEPYQRVEMNKLIKEFENENNCTVTVSELSWGDGKTKLLTAFSSNTAPDVLELGSDWVAQFSSAGVLLELDKNEFDIDKFVDFSQAPCYWNDKIYALPWTVDTRVIFYNKDLFKQAGLAETPPTNYSEMLDYVSKINQIKDVYGFGANGSDEHRLYKKIVPMFWTYGGEVFDENMQPVLNSPENIQAMEMYAQLSRYGMIETQRQLDAAFVQGKIGIWLSGGWLLKKIKNENPDLNFGVTEVPGAGDKKGVSFAGGEYFAANAKSKNPELAKKLLKYLTGGKTALEFCKQITEAGFPADKNYYNDPYYNNFPDRLVFAKQLENSRMTPVHPKWLSVEKIIEEKTVEVLYGKTDPQEALNKAQQETKQIIE